MPFASIRKHSISAFEYRSMCLVESAESRSGLKIRYVCGLQSLQLVDLIIMLRVITIAQFGDCELNAPGIDSLTLTEVN
jgi:hypothetical protein